ncbi:Uncharacterised protein [Shigella sonnei]|nr:hypothetical protein DP20_3781 [Shigella flexneri]CSI33296.1 Uncharacterised protein [Shigella sonnei]CSP51107.1 Uncharacterised protein [Shigella sonnei]CSP84820.1 Uncharacterised protein [Shigella sonnei]CST28580.1 Uncharacterised protein [Shigella sonnei]
MANALCHLFTAPVQQGTEEKHQRTMHHKAPDMRRLPNEPGGGGANIRADFRHDRRTPHIQQVVPACIQLRANHRNGIKPRQIG